MSGANYTLQPCTDRIEVSANDTSGISLGPTMRDAGVGYQPVQVAVLQVGRSLKAGLSQVPGLPLIFCRT